MRGRILSDIVEEKHCEGGRSKDQHRQQGEAGCGRETDVPADGAAKEGGGGDY